MIRAVGIDIVSVARIEKLLQNPRFAPRILTESERAHELSAPYVAGRWAAKEAAKKCVPELSSWHEIEILNQPSGQPVAKSLRIPAGHRLWVSISHEREFATSVAILED